MKHIFLTAIILLSFFSVVFSQYDDEFTEEIKNIKTEYAKIVKGAGFKYENPKFQEEDGCMPTIAVKRNGNEIKFIELSFNTATRKWSKQYFYKDDEIIFVYTEKSILDGEADDGTKIIRAYEYRHYYSNEIPIRSMYRGFKYRLDEEPDVKNIIFYDYDKAYDERENAQKYLEWAKTNTWDNYCK